MRRGFSVVNGRVIKLRSLWENNKLILKIGFIFLNQNGISCFFFLLTLGYMILKITLITVCGIVCAFDRGGVL